MDISRRRFNRGALALAAMTTMPLRPIPAAQAAGFDDAYSRIMSEMCRVEEAAGLMGRAGSGAMTWKGRQLESFLGALDLRITPAQSAGQIFGELRDFLTDKARGIAQPDDEPSQTMARQIRSYADSWLNEADASGDEVEPVPNG